MYLQIEETINYLSFCQFGAPEICHTILPCNLIPTTFERGDTCTYAGPVVPGVYLIASVTETHPSSGRGLTPEVT